MLEIILLYFSCKHIGALAIQKKLKPGRWKIITILTWLSFEMLGFVLGILFFGFDPNSTSNLWGLMLFALCCGFGGYLIVRNLLERKQ